MAGVTSTSQSSTAQTQPRTSSLRLSRDSFQEQQAYQERISSEVGAQGKQWNASILRNTNRIQSTVDKPELQQPTGLVGEPRMDPRGSMLLQRPLPTASIPHIQEKGPVDPQLGVSVEVDRRLTASADVTGLAINYRTSVPSSEGEDEISSSTNDKGRTLSGVLGKSQRLASLPSRPPNSPKQSPRSSLVSSLASTPTELELVEDGDEIPMISFSEKQLFDLIDENDTAVLNGRPIQRTHNAHTFVQPMSRPDFQFLTRLRAPSPSLLSRQETSSEDRFSEDRDSETYVERPAHYRRGILSSILKLYDHQSGGHNCDSQGRGRYGHSRQGSTSEWSGRGLSPDPLWKPHRPQKWYEKPGNHSTSTLSGSSPKKTSPMSMLKRSRSSGAVSGSSMGGVARRWMKPQLEDEIRITVHIAELLSRQRYLIRLCRALMKYGAPTHRLEEYMRMTARVLEIDGQFLYIPGCMIISFDDTSTHTTEVKVVRSSQGIDLGKLADVHEIYKEVIHDVIGVEEATQRLDTTMKRPSKFHILFLIFAHGCASASVGPFAFNARPIDIPIAFLLGCLLGVLQLILSPKSSLYSNVFEISAAVLTSFLARAFGSIRFQGEPLFCFSALSQASIALILPGYTVLSASLELQSRSIVAGSVRMVYAIIYSLFLGFGITIGTAVYGLLDPQASTAYTCPASPITNEYVQHFPFVVIFTICLAVVNHAKWKQIPVMATISLAGYVVSYFSSKRFSSNTQVSNALGAFVIGVMGNFYSRIRHGLAAAAMLPAIFVLVPSGLAASGSLISGITSAEQMTRSPYAVVANGTQGFVDAAKNLSAAEQRNQSYGVVFDIGYGMVQVAIGTTVGLFLAALVVYPFGKKRSGLFSF
ncbi:hypothetical protein N7532_002080 [Penicillium argentinense]|uniref:DUF1212 domain membrane protein Prm10 n=1 Tax=Penicillium argentinense TaxID=1131581 RepID=A0A9W9G4M1_9EURO|nr:uncharacterized protein N7532_002080 [Penicillium argentinense]KAJ5111545.1 hypothetical protein N7532_002080 [Penicillium argentinense]